MHQVLALGPPDRTLKANAGTDIVPMDHTGMRHPGDGAWSLWL